MRLRDSFEKSPAKVLKSLPISENSFLVSFTTLLSAERSLAKKRPIAAASSPKCSANHAPILPKPLPIAAKNAAMPLFVFLTALLSARLRFLKNAEDFREEPPAERRDALCFGV